VIAVAYVDDLIDRVSDADLRSRLRREVRALRKRRKFGLVFEEHQPEAVALPGLNLEAGGSAVLRDGTIVDVVDVPATPPPRLNCAHSTSRGYRLR